jgi:hypothetical protein
MPPAFNKYAAHGCLAMVLLLSVITLCGCKKEAESSPPSENKDSEIAPKFGPKNVSEFWGFKSQQELFDYVNDVSTNPKDQFGARRLKPDRDLWNVPQEIVRFSSDSTSTHNSDRLSVDRTTTYVDETIIIDPKPVYLSSWTGVFSFSRHKSKNRPVLIKYHIDCPGEIFDPVNSVILESFFMEKLAPVGLSPPVYYYSESVSEMPSGGNSEGFKKIDGNLECLSKGAPSLRYVVTEFAGNSMNDFVAPHGGRPVLSFIDIMKLGAKMMEYLEILHSYSVIHGDAHIHNWVSLRGRISMIDFGRSRIIFKNEIQKVEPCHTVDPLHHLWTTKWELLGCTRQSFRDDVYNALFMISALIHGEDWLTWIEYLVNSAGDAGKAEHIRLKLGAIFFDYSVPSESGISVKEGILHNFSLSQYVDDQGKLNTIRSSLTDIGNEILNVDKIESKPNYFKIKGLFGDIVKLLNSK